MAMTAESLRGELYFTIDLKNGLIQQTIRSQLMKGDKSANTVVIALMENKKEVDLSGVTVTGAFISPEEGAEIPLTGSVDGNKAIVTLIDECYAKDGYFECHIKLTAGNTSRTILSFTGNVLSKGSGAVIDIGNVIPSIDDIIAQYKTMQEVTESTNAAKEAANTAAKYANSEAKKIDGLTVDAKSTDMPSAETSVKNGVRHITFGLVTPKITFEVETGPAGTDVMIEQSGTPENPVVKLTIPRGDTGNIDGLDYYEGNPAALGKASPGTANGVARGNHVHPMPTAEDVGARPSTWTPTAEDVGARPSTWTPTAEDVGARPSTWTPTAEDVGALARDAQAADSAKLGGNDPEYYMPDYGRGAVLWEGNWSGGTITVPNTSKYIGFQIIMTDIAATILAMKNAGSIRGIGGHAASESLSLYSYHFSAKVSGDEWELTSCRSTSHNPSGSHGANSNQTVSKIIGLF